MDHLDSLFETRLNRRTAMKGMLAASAAAVLTSRGIGALAYGNQSVADYPELVIIATEYALDIPATTSGGWTRLTLDNQGLMDHHVMFMRVNDGSTLEELEAALLEPAFEPTFTVSTSVGGPFAAPGGRGSVIAELQPGSYVLICVIPDEAGMPHYALGMQAVLNVTEGDGTGEAPASDATIELMEMQFHNLAAEFPSGPQVWKVDNIGGAIHEMVVVKLAPGFGVDEARALLLTPPEATPMDHDTATPTGDAAQAPFVVVGGVAPMSPHQTNYAEFDFEQGDYLAICFVPDSEGVPHMVLGMLMPFTVA